MDIHDWIWQGKKLKKGALYVFLQRVAHFKNKMWMPYLYRKINEAHLYTLRYKLAF